MEGSSYNLDNDQAVQLFENGGIVLLLDVPTNTEIGLDYNSWQTGEMFKGIKMIPPGFHFIYYRHVYGKISPRTSIMHFFNESEVLIKKWDAGLEDFVDENDSETIERYKCNRRELDKYLGAYPYDNHRKWVSLTNFVSKDVLDRINPESDRVSSVAQFQSLSSTTESRKNAKDMSHGKKITKGFEKEDFMNSKLPQMNVIPGTELKFSNIPKINHVGSPSEITKYNMDQSHKIKYLLKYTSSAESLLGELQICFVCFLMGQAYEAFEQWKKLVGVLCQCVDAITEYPDLYFKFINVLHYHIKEIPEDFFVDIISKDNFLSKTLSEFFENLEVSDCPDHLKQKGLRFKNNLQKRFNLSFDCELGEFAPVVVE
ncbi:hypothetical protein HELRODRAFT_73126 [Helobdella robusta]|uniref:Protein AAR2 homolog n=1 Tax=Helobdella robusta TaxID=6412 RepID=T1G1A5_HELRO|nr:hypothetical protein HELRODRAFT_73126 [Helobdella robusta]ESO09897.1 hypothetical protein HELRODRAFT_73126 [Helobdella robusta]